MYIFHPNTTDEVEGKNVSAINSVILCSFTITGISITVLDSSIYSEYNSEFPIND